MEKFYDKFLKCPKNLNITKSVLDSLPTLYSTFYEQEGLLSSLWEKFGKCINHPDEDVQLSAIKFFTAIAQEDLDRKVV